MRACIVLALVVALAVQACATCNVPSVFPNTNFFEPSETATVVDVVASGAPAPPTMAVVADVSGDGVGDVVYATTASLEWALSAASGTNWATTATIEGALPGAATALKAADLTNSGTLDVVVATDAPSLVWYANTGGGSFAAGAPLALPGTFDTPTYIDIGDVNGDGLADIVAGSAAYSSVVLVANGGGSVFLPGVDAVPVTVCVGVALYDLAGKGFLDILVADFAQSSTLGWYANNGTGSFEEPRNIIAASAGLGAPLIVTDVSGVGARVDIIAQSLTEPEIKWFTGGNGSFSTHQFLFGVTNTAPRIMTMADVLGDGRLELVIAHDTLTIAVFEIHGDYFGIGRFKTLGFRIGTKVYGNVVAGDATGDGKVDILGIDFSTGTTELFVNTPGLGRGYADFASSLLNTGTTYEPTKALIADVNGDGAEDLVVTGGGVVFVGLLSGGPTTSAAGISLDSFFFVSQTPTVVADFAVGDVDADGDFDIVVADAVAGTIVVYRNEDGDSQYVGPTTLITDTVTAFVLADMDDDGLVDVVAGRASGDELVWYRASGAGAFDGGRVVVASSLAPITAVSVGDLTGNGRPDIVFATDAAVGAVLNTDGVGTAWSVGPTVTVGPAGTAITLHLGDINGDGLVDVAYMHSGGNVGWIANVGSGSLAGTASLVAVGGAWAEPGFGLIDADNDETLDLVVPSVAQDAVLWYANPWGNGSFASTAQVVRSGMTAGKTRYLAGDTLTRTGRNTHLFMNNQIVSAVESVTGTAFAPSVVADVERGSVRMAQLVNTSTSPCFRFGPGRGQSVQCLSDMLRLASGYTMTKVYIPPGVYTVCPTAKHLLLPRMAHAVADPVGSVTIDCSATAGVMYELSDAYVSLALDGFVVRGMGASASSLAGAPGIRVTHRDAYIRFVNSTVEDCSTVPQPSRAVVFDGGGGAVLADDGNVYLTNSVFARNTAGAGTSGGALFMTGVAFMCADGASVLEYNSAQSGSGGAVLGSDSTIEFHDESVVRHNVADRFGGGVMVRGGNGVRFRAGSRLVSNTAARGGGGAAASTGSFIALYGGSVVEGNSATKFGGGVYAFSGGSMFGFATDGVGATVRGNTAGKFGGGIGLADLTLATFTSVVVENNMADVGGGVGVAAESVTEALTLVASLVDLPATPSDPSTASFLFSVDFTSSIVRDNTARLYGSAMLLCGGERVDIYGGTVVVNGDVTVCLPTGGTGASPFVPDRASESGVPWMFFDTESFALNQHLVTRSPPVSLEWAKLPPLSLAPGIELTGSVRLRDWFGQVVVDPRLRVVVSTLTSTELAGSPVALLAASGPSLLPPVVFVVADAAVLPIADAQLFVSLRNELGVDVPDPALQLTHTLVVDVCPIGYGGVVSGETGAFSCVACGGETYSPEASVAPCAVCPPNSVIAVGTNATSITGCGCVPGFYPARPLVCVGCPEGGVCVGGDALPTSAPGYFPAGGNTFVACPNPEACVGNGRCQAGYGSRLCAECVKGYYALNGKCFKCDSSRVGLVVFVVLIVVGGALALLLVFNLMQSVSYKFAAAMIGLNGLQISAIYGRLDLEWGGFAEFYFDVASSLNLNLELTSPECSAIPGTDVWVLKYLLTLCLPIFAGVSVCAVAGLFWVLGKVGMVWLKDKTTGELVDGAKRCWYQVMVLLYMPLCAGALSLFGCRKDQTGRWVLDAAPARSCYTSTWWGLFLFGVFGVVVYAFGLPAAVVWVLRKARSELDELTFVLRYGFLVGRFEDEGWWYEAGIMGRKLGVVLCMTFFWADTSKAYAAVWVLVGCLGHLVYMRPYRSTLHNVLAVVVLASVCAVLHSGTFVNRELRLLGVVGGIVVNLGAIVVGNVLDVLRLRSKEADVEEHEFYGGDMMTDVAGGVEGGYGVEMSGPVSVTDTCVSVTGDTGFGPGGNRKESGFASVSGGKGGGETNAASSIGLAVLGSDTTMLDSLAAGPPPSSYNLDDSDD